MADLDLDLGLDAFDLRRSILDYVSHTVYGALRLNL